MNLSDYGRILLRRGWIPVLLAVLAAGAAFAFSQFITPVYRSTQTILLVPSRSDFGLTQAVVQNLNNRVAFLRSDLVAQGIIDQLQLDMSPGELRSYTEFTAVRDNLTIQVDVDMPAPDAPTADRLINPIAAGWGTALIQYQNDLNQRARSEDRITAQIQDNPKISLLRPNTRINVILGGLIGLFLGAVIVFVLEYVESGIVRDRRDIERDGLRVLASIPE